MNYLAYSSLEQVKQCIRLTEAQTRVLNDLVAGDVLIRCRDGWKSSENRFVPLIVVAKLRKQGLVRVDATQREARATLFGKGVLEALQS